MSLNTSATMGFPFSTIASAATPGLRALSLHFLLTALSSCYVNSGLGHSKPRRKSSDSGQRSPVYVLLSLAARAAAEPQRGSGGKFVPFPSRVCCSSWQRCGLWLSSACALLSSRLSSPSSVNFCIHPDPAWCWKVLACSAVFALQVLCREQQDEETAVCTHCISHDLLFFQAAVLSPGSHPVTRRAVSVSVHCAPVLL